MLYKFLNYAVAIAILTTSVGCESATKNSIDSQEAFLPNYFTLNGNAQGTTYTITYQDSLQRDFSIAIDSLLKDYDMHLSTYIDSSLVSKFNKVYDNGMNSSLATFDYDFAHCYRGPKSVFENCIEKSKEVYRLTDGAFNPALFPLVNYWGFFKSDTLQNTLTQKGIDSLLSFCKFDDENVFFTTDSVSKGGVHLGCYPLVVKTDGRIQLDFNAIAQGHSVDVVAQFFILNGIHNFIVEIGGELRTSGLSYRNKPWHIGVDKPIEGSLPGSHDFQFIVALSGQSLATSGNYRKFYEKDGQKYSHTIDPKTGRPVMHNLLSVTVIAPECALADAYATAFMVMGTDKSLEFIEKHPQLELHAYFVEDSNAQFKTILSKGFSRFLVE